MRDCLAGSLRCRLALGSRMADHLTTIRKKTMTFYRRDSNKISGSPKRFVKLKCFCVSHVIAVQDSSHLLSWGQVLTMNHNIYISITSQSSQKTQYYVIWKLATASILAKKNVLCICETPYSVPSTQQIGNVKRVLGQEQ